MTAELKALMKVASMGESRAAALVDKKVSIKVALLAASMVEKMAF